MPASNDIGNWHASENHCTLDTDSFEQVCRVNKHGNVEIYRCDICMTARSVRAMRGTETSRMHFDEGSAEMHSGWDGIRGFAKAILQEAFGQSYSKPVGHGGFAVLRGDPDGAHWLRPKAEIEEKGLQMDSGQLNVG